MNSANSKQLRDASEQAPTPINALRAAKGNAVGSPAAESNAVAEGERRRRANEEIAALVEVQYESDAPQDPSLTDGEHRTLLLRRAQEQVRRRESARQAAILNALPEKIALLDANGEIVSVNEAWREFGKTSVVQGPGYEVGLNYVGICRNATGERASEAHKVASGIHKVLGGTVKSFSIEYPCDSAAGRRWFLMTVTPLSEDDPYGAVVVHLNITERKRDEAELKLLNAAMDATADAILLIDRSSMSFIHVNDAACRFKEASRDELMSLEPWGVVATSREELERTYDTIIAGGVPAQPVELMLKHKDGSPVWVELRRNATRSGDRWMIVTLVRDITDRKQAEASIHRLNANLEQRVTERTAELKSVNAELESFSYSVSHDLRAPLRHIVGFVERLREDARQTLSAENLLHLSSIARAATRMGGLIDDLLTFSHVGQIELQKTPADLAALVRDAMDDVRPETVGRNITWNIHPLPKVLADRALLRMVLVNLISNAVKFTGARAAAAIEIGTTDDDGDRATIFIRDNGAGFDPQYSAKLFGAFQRLHSQAEFAGSGVGLANVQRIIRRHGGRVWANGAVDQGATFYFTVEKAQP